MMKPKIPANEKFRQAILDSYNIVDSLPEQSFDDLTLIASQVCDTPIALVSLIDNDRQWFKSKFGIDAIETSRDISFCGHAINEPSRIFQVSNAKEDVRFSDNPLVTGDLDIGFYAGVPLVDSSNMALGTLCVIDQTPKELSEHQVKALEAIARQVIVKIEDRARSLALISEIDQKDKTLNELQVKYFRLYQEAPDMMISVDPKSRKIVECNAIVIERLGYSEKELVDTDIFELFHPESIEEAKSVLQEFKELGSVLNKRLILKTKSGEKINVSLNIKAVKNEKGETLYSNSILRDIDDLVSAENKLQKLNAGLEAEITKRTGELGFQKKRLELVLEGTKDGILDWVDVNKKEIWWSPGLNKMLGYGQDEIPHDISFLVSLVHPEDKKASSDSLNKSLRDGAPVDMEFRLKTKNNIYKWLRIRANSIKDENGTVYRITGSLSDINDRKELELELTKTKTFLGKVTDIAPSIIYVFDQLTMKNEYSNREVAESLGYSEEEIKAMGDQLIPSLCHPDDLNFVLEHFQKIRTLKNNESASVEYRLKHKNGNYIFLLSEDTVFERDAEGNVTKHLGVATDITSVKEDHRKLSIQADLLKQQNEEIKQFAYVAMHDMKNPIMTLEGHLDYLKTQFENPSEEITESIEFIDEELSKFKRTLSGLNDAVQIKEVSVQMVPVDINSVINRLVALNEAPIAELGGSFSVNLSNETHIIGTDLYIESILMNLISNAIKYSSPVRKPLISIRTEVEQNFLLFEIEDNGLGIDTTLQKDRLFKMFNRFHHHPEGSGMGLYLVKSMTEKLGGTIKIESEVDRGTKFSVRLKIQNVKTT